MSCLCNWRRGGIDEDRSGGGSSTKGDSNFIIIVDSQMSSKRRELKTRLESLLKEIDKLKKLFEHDQISTLLHLRWKISASIEMDFAQINKVAKMGDFLPTKKLSELTQQSDYQITDMRAVETKFGKRIIVDVRDEFAVFLPARLAKVFHEDNVTFMKMIETAHNGQLYMNYFGGKYNSVEFKQM